jgi:hypothetical protein
MYQRPPHSDQTDALQHAGYVTKINDMTANSPLAAMALDVIVKDKATSKGVFNMAAQSALP